MPEIGGLLEIEEQVERILREAPAIPLVMIGSRFYWVTIQGEGRRRESALERL